MPKLAELGNEDLVHVGDALTIRSILGLVALAKGALELGTWISYADESEIQEALEERQGWSNHYRRDLT
jgi:hypothetical protein